MPDASSPAPQPTAAPAAPAGAPFVRCEVRSPRGQQALAAYAKAVEAMKARPDTNQTSWAYQAAMHGTHKKPLAPLWNGCKHYSWYFVVWHRMFVYYFEEIVRAAVVQTGGPADWALPYWDYELGGVHASIPDAFREPHVNGAPNPLYVAERAPGINKGAQLPPAVTTSKFALARPNFIGATEFGGGEAPPTPQFWREPGELEETPHNAVHGAVGGRGGWMNDPDRAAQDPIFWLHHTQIDRLWARWNSEGHANPTKDKAWSEQPFEFFGTDRKQTSKRCIDVLNTVVDLKYEYDRLKP
jgi:tyrosinase